MKKVKILKAKIKLKLKHPEMYEPYLVMYIKLEDELFYWHDFNILNGNVKKYRTREQFYNAVYDVLMDKNLIIRHGEKMVKDILKERLENINTDSKEKEVKMLLKQLKQPIEIEVEG